MRNPPEKWNSAGITGSWSWVQTGKIKIFRLLTIPGTLTLKDLYLTRLIIKIKKLKIH
jgi:hypothetical protein